MGLYCKCFTYVDLLLIFDVSRSFGIIRCSLGSFGEICVLFFQVWWVYMLPPCRVQCLWEVSYKLRCRWILLSKTKIVESPVLGTPCVCFRKEQFLCISSCRFLNELKCYGILYILSGNICWHSVWRASWRLRSRCVCYGVESKMLRIDLLKRACLLQRGDCLLKLRAIIVTVNKLSSQLWLFTKRS